MIKKLFLTLFLSGILFACVKKRDLTQNTVIAHITAQPDGLHPFNDNSIMRSYIFNYTQKTLIKLDLASLEYIPVLIKEMPKVSSDNLSFSYEIKEGIFWDDGSPLTTKDVVFSTKLMLCPLTNNAQIRGNYNSVIKSVELDPNNKMKFTMHAQNINWTNRYIFTELYIVQKSLWDPKGVLDGVLFSDLLSENFKETESLSEWFNNYNDADNGYKPERLLALGAYQVSEWEANQYITIEKKEKLFERIQPERLRLQKKLEDIKKEETKSNDKHAWTREKKEIKEKIEALPRIYCQKNHNCLTSDSYKALEAPNVVTGEDKCQFNWWGSNDDLIYNKAYPDKIIFKIIKEDASSYLALKNEEIDVTTRVGTVKLMKLQEREYFNNNYDSDFLDQYSFNYIGLNMKPDGIKYKPFFVDQRVRRAMAYLTPVDEIIEVMVHGKASRQAAQISHLKKVYNDTLKLIPLDIEKAKQLLEEAGWTDTDGDNIRDKIIDGVKVPFSFKLSYMSSPISKEIVLMIKESMYKGGVVAEPTPMDFTLFYKNAMDHNFDGMLGGWGGSASYSNPMQLWHTSSWVTKGSNFCGFGDAKSDALIEEANLTLDKEQHDNALLKLQAKIYTDQPYVFLYSTKRKFAIHKRFENREMYYERPGVMLQNLKLIDGFSSTIKVPTNGE